MKPGERIPLFLRNDFKFQLLELEIRTVLGLSTRPDQLTRAQMVDIFQQLGFVMQSSAH